MTQIQFSSTAPLNDTTLQSPTLQNATHLKESPVKESPDLQDFQNLRILPWQDEILDASGYDPRSVYVEMFWLPVLGPSSIWLMRRLSIWLEGYPGGFELTTTEIAQELGIGNSTQKIPPIKRTLIRCSDFGLIHFADNGCIYVKKCFPRISKRLEGRLSDRLKKVHHLWMAAQASNQMAAQASNQMPGNQTSVQQGEPSQDRQIIAGYLALEQLEDS